MSDRSELEQRISKRMQNIMRKVTRIVENEVGEGCLVGILVQPWQDENVPGDVADMQYGCNAPREFMREAMRAMVDKWDEGVKHTPPHERQ